MMYFFSFAPTWGLIISWLSISTSRSRFTFKAAKLFYESSWFWSKEKNCCSSSQKILLQFVGRCLASFWLELGSRYHQTLPSHACGHGSASVDCICNFLEALVQVAQTNFLGKKKVAQTSFRFYFFFVFFRILFRKASLIAKANFALREAGLPGPLWPCFSSQPVGFSLCTGISSDCRASCNLQGLSSEHVNFT